MPQNTSEHENKDIANTGGNNEEKKYPFIREVIKPVRSRTKILTRIIWIVGGAAAAGLIAAFVFVRFFPTAERLFGEERQRERIRVVSESSASDEDQETADSSAESTADNSADDDASSGSSAGSSSGAGSSEAGSDGQTEKDEADSAVQNKPEEKASKAEKDLVEEYRKLQKELNYIAANSEKYVVQVIGIKSEMDYFNASYENEQQVSGITFAEDDDNYFILTERTPLIDAEKTVVRFAGLLSCEAEMIRADANTGLAVIKVNKEEIDETQLRIIEIAELGSSYSLLRGEPVIAVGSPMGYEGMTSVGTITSAGNEISMYDAHYHLFNTDIAGTQSGSGALVNLDGKVVGIIRQTLGTSGNSIVQALGISEITDLIDTLTNNEARPYAGIRGETVTASVSEKTGIPQGMLIREVETDAPAMLAGMMQFDVVIKVNDKVITSAADYAEAIAACKPGQDIHITTLRKGPEVYEEMTFKVLLDEI